MLKIKIVLAIILIAVIFFAIAKFYVVVDAAVKFAKKKKISKPRININKTRLRYMSRRLNWPAVIIAGLLAVILLLLIFQGGQL